MRSERLATVLVLGLGLLAVPALPAAQTAPAGPTADDLFNPGVVHDLHLTVNSRDWRDLKDGYRENTYYLADLRWQGLVARNV
jgi:hypothetical protein